MEEMKPCPFCGGKGQVVVRSFDLYQHEAVVECKKCGARAKGVPESVKYAAEEIAIEEWNKRQSVACPDLMKIAVEQEKQGFIQTADILRKIAEDKK